MCLQNEEDRILQAMEAYYGTQGYEVHVLIYDGCLIARKDEKPFPARYHATSCPTIAEHYARSDVA